MWSEAQLMPTTASSSLTWLLPCHLVAQTNHCSFLRLPSNLPLHSPARCSIFNGLPPLNIFSTTTKLRVSRDEIVSDTSATPLHQQDQPDKEVEQSIGVLKNAAKTRKVPKTEVLSALAAIEKAKLDPVKFLQTLGGSESPGRTWMLVFTAEKQLKGGRYFPLTAVQRFDAEGKKIENGVYLGPLGSLSFEGRFSWNKRILAFIFVWVRLKIGPFNPLEVSLGNQDNREPSTKDPFFIWFYVDEEIAVARGRSGGTAFWCRCRRVTSL